MSRFEKTAFLPESLQPGLPFHHRDPFDRLIVAQALEDTLPLLSADQIMDRYGAQRVW